MGRNLEMRSKMRKYVLFFILLFLPLISASGTCSNMTSEDIDSAEPSLEESSETSANEFNLGDSTTESLEEEDDKPAL
jgi:hypothetical protein